MAELPLEEVVLSEEQLKEKEWRQKSITGKCPTLETPEGNLVESAAIARYLGRLSSHNLSGSTPFEQAQVDQWIDFTHGQVQPNVITIARATLGWAPVEGDVYNGAVKDLKDAIKVLNTHLQGKQHLVGGRYTVADVVVGVTLLLPFQLALDAGFRKAMPNVSAWLENFVKLPQVVARLGHVKFAQKIVKPVAPPKKEEKKEVAAPVKKVEKTEEEKAAGKNPLDLLPPSPFVLPDFKTFFVNIPDKAGEGMKRFFETYDPAGYTIYFVHYEKYEGEGVVLYQTSNLMNGFLQRIDSFRVHVFSGTAILGEEPNLDIEGVWLFRGKGIPQEMIDHPQFEYYTKRELDVTKEEDRNLITEFWSKPSTI